VSAPALLPRVDDDLPDRLMRSRAAVDEGTVHPTRALSAWLARQRARHGCRVERIPFAELDGWSFTPGEGNLVHRSGRFFSVEGLDVAVDGGPDGGGRAWQQPIIVQPEVGILGLLAREIGGVLHVLVQAKVEPGNRGLVQLSPTVQATHSNYTGVHRGTPVRYLEHFTEPGRVLADVLQSEHGSWFLHKVNRNMLVEVTEDVPVHEDFRWVTLGQLGVLLRTENAVNMDTRTVLATVPVPDAAAGALNRDVELVSWISRERARRRLAARRVPLAGTRDWHRGADRIAHATGGHFEVVAVAVDAPGREVRSWTQPLFAPVGRGLAAFVVRRVHGVPHVLVHARVEAGFLDTVELGPTVQCTPREDGPRPPFLDLVEAAGAAQVRFDTVLSEEGGRFHHAETRYVIVETDERTGLLPPPGYRWLTPGQLGGLVQHGRYLNVQARTLLAVLNTGAAGL
jgi:dTDP-4-dehydro-6-deoxy-alpha-D-glucopyranose 2,3-dehydratase